MTPLALALNTEYFKYVILVLLAPFWIPFFRSLWRTLNDSLREEGGLFGRPPTDEQLKALEAQFGNPGDHLTSSPKRFAGDEARQQRTRSRAGRATAGGGRSPGSRTGRAAPPRRGF